MKRALRALVVILPALAACGGGTDATAKQLDDLRAEVAKVRSEHAAVSERLDALEMQRGGLKGYAPTSGATPGAAPSGDRPELDVVKLGPDGEESDDTDDAATRPVLRSSGGGSVVEEAQAKGKPNAAAQKEYEQALDLYRGKQFDKALDAFAGFLAKYPDHASADNATFWRGECYFAKTEYRRAAEQFEAVANNYPKGNKAPDALLKLAQAYGKLGETASADGAKKKLLATYPTSEAARKLGRGSAPKKP